MGSLYIIQYALQLEQTAQKHKAFSAPYVYMHTQIQSLASPDRKAVWLPHSGLNGYTLNLINVATF